MHKIAHFIFFISITLVTTDCIANSTKYDLQTILNKTLTSKDAIDAHISGIPLTFQCSGFNNNEPVSLATGKINDQSNTTLPIDAMYQIGSETKSFTAVVALQLEAEGVFGSKGLDNRPLS